MIFDFSRIKGVVLIRLPSTKAGQAPALRAQDVMPLMTLGSTDASQWRPDGAMAQNSERSTSVAQAPLASGTQMANHARTNPRRETFDAILTDTPILPTTLALAAVGLHRADSLIAP